MEPLAMAQTAQAAESAFSGIFDIGWKLTGGQKRDEERQQGYNKELMELQNQYNMQSQERAFEMAKEMYEYTGYGSKVRQMKEAGLNPALMYGMGGGAGGSTAGSPGAMSVSPGAAPNTAAHRANSMAATGMALQLAKLKSEIDVNTSIAKANTAQAQATTEGSLPKMKQEIENLKTTKEGQELINLWQTIDNRIKGATEENVIESSVYLLQEAKYRVIKMQGESQSATAKGKVDEATIETAINQQNANVEKTIGETILNNSKRKLTEEEAKAVTEKVKQEYYKLLQGAHGLKIDILALQTKVWETLQNNNAAMDRTVVNNVADMLKSMVRMK